ncbi:MAG: hypothetical protein D6773_00505 [Alphaproteobacteria bacterium]|nr:MAG: hypothetical protein D6773_00505 [Alphaproteobacteria bacterium]
MSAHPRGLRNLKFGYFGAREEQEFLDSRYNGLARRADFTLLSPFAPIARRGAITCPVTSPVMGQKLLRDSHTRARKPPYVSAMIQM